MLFDFQKEEREVKESLIRVMPLYDFSLTEKSMEALQSLSLLELKQLLEKNILEFFIKEKYLIISEGKVNG